MLRLEPDDRGAVLDPDLLDAAHLAPEVGAGLVGQRVQVVVEAAIGQVEHGERHARDTLEAAPAEDLVQHLGRAVQALHGQQRALVDLGQLRQVVQHALEGVGAIGIGQLRREAQRAVVGHGRADADDGEADQARPARVHPVADLAPPPLQGRVDAVADAKQRRGGNEALAVESRDGAQLEAGRRYALDGAVEVPALWLARQQPLPGGARNR